MKKLILKYFPMVLLVLSSLSSAQENSGKVGITYRIKLNKINIPITNNGIIANVNLPPDGCLGYYDEIPFLFSSGFILGGYANNNLWVNAQASSSLWLDYLPGKVNDSNNPDNQIYVVKSTDPPFGLAWLDWVDAVKLGAKFYDGDKDGLYSPVDRNKNKAWDLDEDMPDLLGDVTVWCVYNDGVPVSSRRYGEVEPQGIEIAQTIFGSSTQQELENILFVRYSITNRGTVADILDSVYVGVWADPDLGIHYWNDKSGCDQILDVAFAYQDILDTNIVPPFFFSSIVQGPIDYTGDPRDIAKIYSGRLIGEKALQGFKNVKLSSFYNYVRSNPSGEPYMPIHIYYFLRGLNLWGVENNPCDFSQISTFVNVSCDTLNPKFLFEGNPFTPSGWLLKLNMDTWMMANVGPFKLKKDIPQEIIVAYSLGEPKASFAETFANGINSVQLAKSEWAKNFSGLSYTNIPQYPEPEIIEHYHLSQNYPNPFNPSTKIKYEIPLSPPLLKGESEAGGFVSMKVYDVLGNEVATLVNKEQPAGTYEVEFNAARDSSPAITSGVYFYQLKVYTPGRAGEFSETKKMILLK